MQPSLDPALPCSYFNERSKVILVAAGQLTQPTELMGMQCNGNRNDSISKPEHLRGLLMTPYSVLLCYMSLDDPNQAERLLVKRDDTGM